MERKWWTLLAVSVATFMLLLDITVVNVALPSIREDLGAGFTDLQWVVDAYALTLTALVLRAAAGAGAVWCGGGAGGAGRGRHPAVAEGRRLGGRRRRGPGQGGPGAQPNAAEPCGHRQARSVSRGSSCVRP
jgi:MFS family permease